MAKYIELDALVAKIEKLISSGKIKCQQSQENNDQVSYIAWSEHIATCGKILSFLDTLEVKEKQPEPYFYCKWCSAKYSSQKFENGGIMPLCSDCKRNHNNSPFKTEEITTWYARPNGTKQCIDYIKEEHPKAGEEYIRKDALLEWAKKELQTNTWYYETHKKPGDVHYGRIEAFKQLIDKLETL